MRGEMSDGHEAAISSCNNMAQVTNVSEKKPEIIPAIHDSIAPVKVLLSSILTRLHGKCSYQLQKIY